MPAPLITGPFESPGLRGRFPSPQPGSIIVAERRDGSYEAIVPGNRPKFFHALTLRNFYQVRLRSGIHEDVHLALAGDIMVQFRIQYSFTLQLDDQQPVTKSAIEAVRYYSRHADPVPLFRARIRQQLNRLARTVSTSGTGLFYDAIGELAFSPRVGKPDYLHADPNDPHKKPLVVKPVEPESGMRVCLEQYIVSPRPRKFND
ncbi:MAG: hypothetical protein R2754_01450 [Microthrixaceae bacterium]